MKTTIEKEDETIIVEDGHYAVIQMGDSYHKSRGLFSGKFYKADMHDCRTLLTVHESEEKASEAMKNYLLEADDNLSYFNDEIIKEVYDTKIPEWFEEDGVYLNGYCVLVDGGSHCSEDWYTMKVVSIADEIRATDGFAHILDMKVDISITEKEVD